MTVIPQGKFKEVADLVPILCVDILISNNKGEYLLVKRVNKPKKGRYWPVGGRVHKDETLTDAAKRKVKQETGLSIRNLCPIGFYQCPGLEGPFGVKSYHTVSIVFAADVHELDHIVLDNQSSDWTFASELPPDFEIETFDGGFESE